MSEEVLRAGGSTSTAILGMHSAAAIPVALGVLPRGRIRRSAGISRAGHALPSAMVGIVEASTGRPTLFGRSTNKGAELVRSSRNGRFRGSSRIGEAHRTPCWKPVAVGGAVALARSLPEP